MWVYIETFIMSLRNLAITFVALAACVSQARADIVLNWHLSNFVPANPADVGGTTIPDGVAMGSALTGPLAANPNSAANPLVFNPGEVKFLQLAINANTNLPTIVGGQFQVDWGVYHHGANMNPTKSLVAWGMDINYPPSLVSQPVTDTSGLTRNNLRAKNFDFQPDGMPGDGEGSTLNALYPTGFVYNTGTTRVSAYDVGLGIYAQTQGIIPDWLFVTFKIRAGNNLGTGQITLTDSIPRPTAGEFGLGDNTNFDTIIFNDPVLGLNMRNFPLFIQVVPEPSSMCFAGLATAGIGWRRLRRSRLRSPI